MSYSANVNNLTPVNERRLRDASYIANVTLPNAGNTANTAALDLGLSRQLPNTGYDQLTTPYPMNEEFVVDIQTTALATSLNSKNINVHLQHASANSDGTPNAGNWANIPTVAVPALRVTDSSGNTAAGETKLLLPPNTRRFIRAQAVCEANNGTNIGGTLTLQLYF